MKTIKPQALWIPPLLAILTLSVFHGVLIGPGIIFGKDTLIQGYPLSWYEAHSGITSMHGGWLSYMMSGFPTTTPRLPYPAEWLFYIFPVARALTWKYILHIFTGVVLMYLLMRRFGRSRAASLAAAVAFGYSAFFISKVYAGHGGAIWTGIWIPLTVLFLDRTIDSRKVSDAVLTGVILGIQVIGQHPQYLYYTGLAVLLYAVWRIVPILMCSRWKVLLPSYIFLAFIAVIFAFLFSAPYTLQFLQVMALSNRSGGSDYAFTSSFSLHPVQLITAAVPSFWGNPVSNNSVFGALYWDGGMFIGTIPLVLAIIAFIWVRDRRAEYFKILAAAAVLIALGKYIPVFKLIYQVPGFSMVRAPSKILFLYSFAAAGLAAYGLDYLTSASISLRRNDNHQAAIFQVRCVLRTSEIFSFGLLLWILVWAAGKRAILSAAAEIIRKTRDNPETVMTKLAGLYSMQLSGLIWAFVLLVLTTLIVILLMRRQAAVRTAAGALFILTFIDLWMYANPLLYSTDPMKPFRPADRRAISVIKADSDRFRILPIDTTAFQYAQGIFDNLESVNGYYPISLERYAAYVGAVNGLRSYKGVSADIVNIKSPLLGLLNVKYIISNKPVKSNSIVEVHSGKTFVYYNKNWLPRVFTVHNIKVVGNPAESLNEIRKPEFDPCKMIVLESKDPVPMGSNERIGDSISTRYVGSDRMVFRANMASAGYLFIGEVYYPMWKAWIDGKPARILPADHLFRAVYVPKGRHEIRMEYINAPLIQGIILHRLSLFLVAGVLGIDFIRCRRKKRIQAISMTRSR